LTILFQVILSLFAACVIERSILNLDFNNSFQNMTYQHENMLLII
jgi:hypothetical protein